ncbi:hypothetical protein SNEBB_000040 [Seison nebaliae]|nr:hypothetical protein SNEBB_000040 [Seison nebaliae]
MNSIDPTQEVPSGLFAEIEEETEEQDSPASWATMYAISSSYSTSFLINDRTNFGRGDENDVVFRQNEKCKFYLASSKNHFNIRKRCCGNKEDFDAELYDTSSNGTFVNGRKIGRGKSTILKNQDEIALCFPTNKAYVYIDKEKNDTNLPPELLQHYVITKSIGRGACGEVMRAFEKKSNGAAVAVKVITENKFTIGGRHQMNDPKKILMEVNIMKELDHPCIVKIIDVFKISPKLFIVLELVEGGELFDRVVQLGGIKETDSKFLFYQMLLAIQYLHKRGISHRDLKPENILLKSPTTARTTVKVTDFGLSKFVDESSMLKTFCGTPNYLAPEILQSKGHGTYSHKVDLWSLGVILFICLVGYPPFSEDASSVPLPKQIVTGDYSFPEEFWGDISKSAIDLIRKLMDINPVSRYTADSSIEHDWIQDKRMINEVHELIEYEKYVERMNEKVKNPDVKSKPPLSPIPDNDEEKEEKTDDLNETTQDIDDEDTNESDEPSTILSNTNGRMSKTNSERTSEMSCDVNSPVETSIELTNENDSTMTSEETIIGKKRKVEFSDNSKENSVTKMKQKHMDI